MRPANHGKQSAGCDHQRIRDFLDSDQYHLDDAELIRHLDHCEACREFLASEAGSVETWGAATELLLRDEFDSASNPEFSSATQSGPNIDLPTAVRDVLESLVPAEDPNHLGRLGPYQVTGVVGVGGMGVVLKAVDPSLDRIVAVKVLSPRLATSETARKRFAREAKAAAAVLHPNVIPIHTVSSDSHLPYLVMACIRGGSLKKRLEKEGSLPIIETLRIATQIAAGLSAAHEQGLIHRDIKPENILLEEGVERVTITDFGLARAVDDNTVTQLGSIAGTPQYMSPEQARGEQLDQQSDLFSLGCVLYEMCAGCPPFQDATSYGVMRKIIDETPTPVNQLNREIPRWLTGIIDKLIAKRRDERFRSAEEVHELLEQCLSHAQQPHSNPLPKVLRGTGKRVWSTRAILMVAGSLALMLCFVCFFFYMQTRPYSALHFSYLRDRLDQPVTELPDEQPTRSSGRLTIGDRDRIMGTWRVVDIPLQDERKADQYLNLIYTFGNGQNINSGFINSTQAPSSGRWEIDENASPRRLLFEFEGVQRKGIYKLQGNFLSVFFCNGTDEYPTAFPSPWGRHSEEDTLLIFLRWIEPELTLYFEDLTPDEAELACDDGADVTLPKIFTLTPELASKLATGKGKLRLPSITELTVETARALAEKQDGALIFHKLKSISPEVASELARSKCMLYLPIDELSIDVATILSSHSRYLSLNALKTITPEAARALVGDNFLNLDCLETLDVNTAAALSQHRGWLSLSGLKSLSPEAAVALQPYSGSNLDLDGLQDLDEETALALIKNNGRAISMNALKSITPEVASILVKLGNTQWFSLQGLEELPKESLLILRRAQRERIDSRAPSFLLPMKFALPKVP